MWDEQLWARQNASFGHSAVLRVMALLKCVLSHLTLAHVQIKKKKVFFLLLKTALA